MASKQPLCTLPDAKNGKHTWKFQKNGSQVSMSSGPRGSTARAKIVGVYACACGASKHGPMNHSAPGNDLRGYGL